VLAGDGWDEGVTMIVGVTLASGSSQLKPGSWTIVPKEVAIGRSDRGA
jgi:hypothetical protein